MPEEPNEELTLRPLSDSAMPPSTGPNVRWLISVLLLYLIPRNRMFLRRQRATTFLEAMTRQSPILLALCGARLRA